MEDRSSLKRFTAAQEKQFDVALAEISRGRKQTHWMWYIFPQIAGLGFSEMSRLYAIRDLAEAEAYLRDPLLGSRLIQISETVLKLQGKTAHQIFGSPDDLKLHSSMTLFSAVPNKHPVFQKVLDKYFNGVPDAGTLNILK